WAISGRASAATVACPKRPRDERRERRARLVRAVGLGLPAGELARRRARGPGGGVLRPGVSGRRPPVALRERYAVRRVPVRRALLDPAELDRFENQLGAGTMSVVSERTRLGLDILAAATLAGIVGGALPRAVRRGLDAC